MPESADCRANCSHKRPHVRVSEGARQLQGLCHGMVTSAMQPMGRDVESLALATAAHHCDGREVCCGDS